MNDIFEKYIKNELTESQRKEFLQNLNQDKNLDQDFQKFMIARHALIQHEENDLRNVINLAKETPVITLRKIITIAASIIVFLGITFVIFNLSTPSANEELFQAYFEPGTYYGNYTRSNLDPSGNLDKGVAFYLDGQLDQAETYLKEVKQISDERQLRQRASLYLGLIALQKDQNEKALEILKQLSVINQVYDDITMDWILALAYLKNDMPAKASLLLKNICEEAANKYAYKSCELLQELNGA